MTAGPAPTPGAGDRLILPVLRHLRTCTATQLGAAGRPVCHFPLFVGDHPPPAAGCDCDCEFADGVAGHGVAWARFVNAVGAGNTMPSECGQALAFTVELGVYRCAPTSDTGDDPVTADVHDPWAEKILADAAALRRAYMCCAWVADRGLSWRLGAQTVLGPRGGCIGVAAQASITHPDCHCPKAAT